MIFESWGEVSHSRNALFLSLGGKSTLDLIVRVRLSVSLWVKLGSGVRTRLEALIWVTAGLEARLKLIERAIVRAGV
eukprot:scaffold15209_cov120-Skeletonema_menzelii.AAC.1